MRIAIFGSGGVGGYYGARLAAAGEEVHFIARGRHLQVMQADGLRVKSANGDLHVRPASATDDPAAIGAVDLVLVAVKLYDTEAAAAGATVLAGPTTAVLSLQNGITAVDTLSAAVGAERVLGGLTYILAVIEAPGVIAHTGTMANIVFGELDGRRTPRAEAFLAACERAGIEAAISDDIEAAIWSKFAFLAPISGMTALTRLTVGSIRGEPETRAMFRDALDEVVAVAQAKGVHLPADIADQHMARFDGLPGEFGSSMLYDLTHGKRLELEWLSGAVVRLGCELGVATPVNAAVYRALKPYADGAPA